LNLDYIGFLIPLKRAIVQFNFLRHRAELEIGMIAGMPMKRNTGRAHFFG